MTVGKLLGTPDEELLKSRGDREEGGEGPSDEGGRRKRDGRERDALVTSVDGGQSSGLAKHDTPHGESRGEEGGGGGPEGGREEEGPEDVAANVGADVDDGGAVEGGFDKGRDGGEGETEGEESDALELSWVSSIVRSHVETRGRTLSGNLWVRNEGNALTRR